MKRKLSHWQVGTFWLLLTTLSYAQGTLADYERASGLREKYQGLAINLPERATWIEKTSRFWYRKTVKGGVEFVLVDAETLAKRPAFDHEKLAASLSAAAGEKYTALKLPFMMINFVDNEKAIEFLAGETRWRCELADYTVKKLPPGGPGGLGGFGQRRGGATTSGIPGPRYNVPPAETKTSPDGKWEAWVNNFNVWVRPKGKRDGIALSFDGSEGNYYALASVLWSPDSTKLAAYRVRPGYSRKIQYVESSPADQLQPKYATIDYAKPGDALDAPQPVLFHVESRKQFIIDNSLFPNPYQLSRIEWRKDSRAFTFEYNQRGHQVYRVVEVEAATAKPRAVISEEPKTFFCYSGKKYRADMSDGKEVVWMSERDGWNHLYLYDGATGAVKKQITKGQWVVRGVDKVDEQKRQIWFQASGMYPGKDPYLVHNFRINLDGTGLTALTEGDGNHIVSFSPDMKYYVDTWSRVDQPTVSELRLTADKKILAELERAEITELTKAGWRAPEVFKSLARDGKTEIWGVIFRPSNFDPLKKYPVIEYIYAGPQGSFVPKSFSPFNGLQSLAELGFIVVQIDGMGTANRSKAFHDVAWKNLGDAGFPDRILWHKAVAAKYPYYDISRVGIYGNSAGGQNSLGGMLFHPEFYKVCVSSCGCHDNRMDKIWWNEQWMGWPLGPEYAASSNVDNAHKLQGKLLLVVGEMDTNVDPASTLQVVNALIKSDKMFDLLVIPGAGHGPGGAYGEKKRNDFFVHHLLGVEPPDWNTMRKKQDSQAAALPGQQ
jgi:Dipeptidyl peptidase IV (DPP IV) N-terminal region/Prolyl oligopeptidase family